MKPTINAAQFKALARKHTRAAIRTLAAIMNQADGPATARVSAAQAILDRGWGKATQPAENDKDNLPLLAGIKRVVVVPGQDGRNNDGGEEQGSLFAD